MPISVHQFSVAAFETQLTAFSAILDKAAAHAEASKFDPAIYATLRMRPDMLPFTRQIMFFCDTAKNGVARIAGVEAPKFEDNEKTLDELKARIAKTLAFLATVDRAALEAGAEREVEFPIGPAKAKMIGRDYLAHFILPNFFFHVATAYDLLRYAGVPIGKRDYLGAVPGLQMI